MDGISSGADWLSSATHINSATAQIKRAGFCRQPNVREALPRKFIRRLQRGFSPAFTPVRADFYRSNRGAGPCPPPDLRRVAFDPGLRSRRNEDAFWCNCPHGLSGFARRVHVEVWIFV